MHSLRTAYTPNSITLPTVSTLYTLRSTSAMPIILFELQRVMNGRPHVGTTFGSPYSSLLGPNLVAHTPHPSLLDLNWIACTPCCWVRIQLLMLPVPHCWIQIGLFTLLVIRSRFGCSCSWVLGQNLAACTPHPLLLNSNWIACIHCCCIRLHSPMCFLAQFADYSVPIKVNSSKIVNLLRKKLLLKEVTTGMMSWLHR